jgi:tyrosyl-tRNA synthetase
VIGILIPLLLLTQAVAPSMEQIKAEPNLERRAKHGVEFAMAAERNAEAAYSRGEMPAVQAELKSMVAAVEVAKAALDLTGQNANRHPGPFKSAELKTQDMLSRLNDLERRMDEEERAVVRGPRARVQEIHDEWFDAIMSKGKKK